MNLLELAAKLMLDSREYKEGLGDAQDDAKSFGSKLGGTFKTAAKVASAAMAAASAAVVAFGKQSVQTGMEFDSSMSQLAATMGMSMDDIKNNVDGAGDTFDALREKARELGGSTVYSAKEAAEGLNILAMSGFNAEQSMSMVEDVLHLAAAGSMDMASAAGYVSGALKGFNDATKDSGYYADLMAKGATLANTSVPELGESLAGSAASAASFGQSAESTTVALLRLAEQGITGSAASTALAAAMKGLYQPSDQAAKSLEKLGISAYDDAGKARDFNDVVNELNEALNATTEDGMAKYTEAQQNALKDTIFGEQGIQAYNKMVVTGIDKQEEWAAALAGASDGMGEAAQQYATMTDNLEGDLAGWSSALSDFQIEISDQLSPTIRDFVQTATSGMQSVTAAFQEGGLDAAVDAAGQVLQDLIGKVTELLPKVVSVATELIFALITGLLDNIDSIAEAFSTLITQGLLGLISALPQVVSAGITLITSLLSGIADALPEIVTTLTSVVSEIVLLLTNPSTITSIVKAGLDIIVALATGLLQALPQLIATIPQLIGQLIPAIIGMIPLLVQAGYDLFVALVQNAPAIITEIMQFLPTLLTELVAGLMDSIPLLVQCGIDLLTSLVDDLPTIIDALITAAPLIIGGLVDGLLNNTDRLIGSAFTLIMSLIQGLINEIPLLVSMAPKLLEGIVRGIVSSLGIIMEQGRKIVDKVKAGFMEKVEAAKQWGKDLIQNFINGITSMITNLKNSVSNIASSIKSFLGFSEPEEGPLSNFHTYAPDMMKLFAKGVKDNTAMLQDQIAESFDFSDMMVNPPEVSTDISVNRVRHENAIESRLNELIDILREHLPGFNGLEVRLDTGVLAGELVGGIDSGLGTRAVYAARGVTA